MFKRENLDQEIWKLLDRGIIEKSSSPWSLQLVLKNKKKKRRVCVDYGLLNSKTIKDTYAIPRIHDNSDALARSVWFRLWI